VKPDELGDIANTGQFINRGAAEGKYFSTSAEGASSYAKQAYYGFGDPPYTMVRTEMSVDMLQSLASVTVDGGITAVVIPDEILPHLIPHVMPWMPIP
jgi:hypothetical protein